MVFVEASKEYEMHFESGLWENSERRVQPFAPGQGRMSKAPCRGTLLERFRSSIAIALVAMCLAPDPTLAQGNFVQGTVIGKNDHGAPLSGVSVQCETTLGGRPCLLRRTRTGKKGSFHVPLDPACPFVTLRFSKAGYLDAIIDVNNSAGDNDVGAIELQPSLLGRSGPSVKASRSRVGTILIVAIIVITSVATAVAVKH